MLKKIVLILIYITLTGNAQTEHPPDSSAAIEIYHHPPQRIAYNQFSQITCAVDVNPAKIESVSIFIKSGPESLYQQFPMNFRKGEYVFKLIPEMTTTDTLCYFFTAEFPDFRGVALPAETPEKNPICVPISHPAHNTPQNSSQKKD